MSDLGDTFRAWKELKQKKRAHNQESSLDLLASRGFKLQQLSPSHFRIWDFDFWPSTGKFLNRKTKRYSRGVRNLLTLLEKKD